MDSEAPVIPAVDLSRRLGTEAAFGCGGCAPASPDVDEFARSVYIHKSNEIVLYICWD